MPPDPGPDQRSILDEYPDDSNIDPYAVLNVSRQATAQEIHQEFKKLSKIFHPDRSKDAENKRVASLQFDRIARARDVLLNPNKRAAYDKFGTAGLDMFSEENEELQQYQLTPAYRTPASIQELIRRMIRKKVETEYEALRPSQGDIVVNVDAIGCYKDFLNGDFEYLMAPEITSYTVKHGFTVSPTPQDFFTVSGSSYVAVNPKTMVYQRVDAELRHHFDNLTVGSVGTHIGTSSLGLRGDIRRIVFGNTGVSLGLGLNFNDGMIIPGITVGSDRQLWKGGHAANVQLKLGHDEGVSCSITKHFDEDTETYWDWGLDVGRAPSTNLKYIKRLDDGIRIFVNASLDLTSDLAAVEAGLSHDLETEIESRINCGLKFSYIKGIHLSLRYQRGNNRLQLPIILSDTNETVQVGVALAIPVALYGLYRWYLRPRVKRLKEERQRERLTEEGKQAKAMRKAAMAQQEMQRPVAQRNMREERARASGLVVLEAWYGRNVADQMLDEEARQAYLDDDFVEDTEFPSRVNARIPLQFQVHDSRVRLEASTKSLLPGLYDCAKGKRKTLYIRYAHRGQEYELVLADEQPIDLPEEGRLR